MSTSLSTLAATYNIKLVGTLPNHQVFTGPISVIDIKNIPPIEYITSYHINDITYIATDNPLNY